jgi:hypothetical protein
MNCTMIRSDTTSPHKSVERNVSMQRCCRGVSLICFVIGTVCFGVFFVRTAGLLAQLPSIDVKQGLRQVAPAQAWGWWFFGLYMAGFAILLCLPGGDRPTEAEQSDARERESQGGQCVPVEAGSLRRQSDSRTAIPKTRR